MTVPPRLAAGQFGAEMVQSQPDRFVCRRLGHPPAVSPQIIGSLVLRQLLQRAADYLGHSQVSKAVITVPAKFDARQRAATAEAFRLAGLQVCCCHACFVAAEVESWQTLGCCTLTTV